MLEQQDYLADTGLATAAFLALRMQRPLFCEGDAGVGKTALATALAGMLDTPLIRLQCYEGLDAAQALYDWDFPRQLLHLRAAEAAGTVDADRLEQERLELVVGAVDLVHEQHRPPPAAASLERLQ